MKKVRSFFAGIGKWYALASFITTYVSLLYVGLILIGPPTQLHFLLWPGNLALASLFGLNFGSFVAWYMYFGTLLAPGVIGLIFLSFCAMRLHPRGDLVFFGIRLYRNDYYCGKVRTF